MIKLALQSLIILLIPQLCLLILTQLPQGTSNLRQRPSMRCPFFVLDLPHLLLSLAQLSPCLSQMSLNSLFITFEHLSKMVVSHHLVDTSVRHHQIDPVALVRVHASHAVSTYRDVLDLFLLGCDPLGPQSPFALILVHVELEYLHVALIDLFVLGLVEVFGIEYWLHVVQHDILRTESPFLHPS